MKTEDYKKELLNIFFAQKQIIILTSVLILLGAIFVAYLWPPTYEAVGTVLVKGKQTEKNQQALEDEVIRTSSITKEDLSSEVEILMSADVIEKTIKYLQKEGKYPPKYAARPNVKAQVDYIRSKIGTNIIPASNVIEIKYTDKDRITAQDILSALMDQYIDHRMEVFYPAGTKDFFAKQTDRFKSDLEKNEDELYALIQTTRGVDPTQEISNNLTTRNNLEQQLNTLSNDAIGKSLDLEQLEMAMSNNDWQHFSTISTNAAITELNRSLLLLFVERGTTLRQYHEESFKIKAIDKQVETTLKELKKEVAAYLKTQKKDLDILLKKIENFNGIIEQINEKNLALKKQMILTDRISRENELYKSSYSTFSKRKEESRLNSADNVTGFFITILSKAFAPETPIFPQKNVILPLGLIFGIITGISLGFIREFFDHTFKNPNDVENYSGMQMIFSLSKLEDKVAKKTFSFTKSLVAVALVPILFIFLYAANTLYSSTYSYSPKSTKVDDKPLRTASSNNVVNEVSTTTIDKVEQAISEKSEPNKGVSDKTLDSIMGNINVGQVEAKKDVELQANLTPKVTKVELEAELTTVETFKTLYSYYDNDSKINALQLYSLSDKDNADATVKRLKTFGLNAYVKSIDNADGRGMLNRVLIRPFCNDNSQKKENFNTHISDISIMINKSTDEIYFKSDRFSNIKNAILTVADLGAIGWLTNIYGYEENGETRYKVVLSKNCLETKK